MGRSESTKSGGSAGEAEECLPASDVGGARRKDRTAAGQIAGGVG